MAMMIEIPPEVEKRLETEAAGRGMTAAEYVREVLEGMFSSTERSPLWLTATKQEWLERFNAWMDSHDAALPPLSDEGTSRESMYGERG
jgi:predicted DNA-binding protein